MRFMDEKTQAIFSDCVNMFSTMLYDLINDGDVDKFDSSLSELQDEISLRLCGHVYIEEAFPFSEAWDLYDKKVDRKKAERKWNSLPDKDKRSAMMHIPLYVASTPNKQFRRNFSTYLNNRSWENEIIDNNDQSSGLAARTRALAEQFNQEIATPF